MRKPLPTSEDYTEDRRVESAVMSMYGMDYEKAFDSVQTWAVLQSLQRQ